MEQITKNPELEISIYKKEKLELIQDIINAKKILFGFGNDLHIDAITHPFQVFDVLYEQDNEELTLTWSLYQAEVSQEARKLAGL